MLLPSNTVKKGTKRNELPIIKITVKFLGQKIKKPKQMKKIVKRYKI